MDRGAHKIEYHLTLKKYNVCVYVFTFFNMPLQLRLFAR